MSMKNLAGIAAMVMITSTSYANEIKNQPINLPGKPSQPMVVLQSDIYVPCQQLAGIKNDGTLAKSKDIDTILDAGYTSCNQSFYQDTDGDFYAIIKATSDHKNFGLYKLTADKFGNPNPMEFLGIESKF